MNEHPPWVIFYGTMTTTVRASSAEAAFDAFVSALSPKEHARPGVGRFVPPARAEVTIRRPSESDRAWIEDSGDPAFLALLRELVEA